VITEILEQIRYSLRGQTAIARIVRYHEGTVGSGHYDVVYERSGEQVQATMPGGSTFSQLLMRDKVPVLYLSESPHMVRRASLWSRIAPTLTGVVFGIIAWLVAIEYWHDFRSGKRDIQVTQAELGAAADRPCESI
jgi:hypothetical protein